MDLPFSQAAANNQQPIKEALAGPLADARCVIEVGAGTGQHAVAFAEAFSHLRWVPTEHPEALHRLEPRCAQFGPENLAVPMSLDLAAQRWSSVAADVVYSANTLHIVDKALVEGFFAGLSTLPEPVEQVFVYGPFNYGGAFTTSSNEHFDQWLRDRDARSGIRDFEWVDELARDVGLSLAQDLAMPANNRLLHWRRG
ncbi:MAG: DUF938 domain-containing protein [Pseudomonadota bacterium]